MYFRLNWYKRISNVNVDESCTVKTTAMYTIRIIPKILRVMKCTSMVSDSSLGKFTMEKKVSFLPFSSNLINLGKKINGERKMRNIG